MKFLSVAILIGATTTALFAQTSGEVKNVERHPDAGTGKKLKLAKSLADQGSFYNAVMYYMDYDKAKPGNIKVLHQIAELNREMRDYVSAEQYYKKVLDLDAGKYPMDGYWYAMMLKMNGKYDEAKTAFDNFSAAYDEDDASRMKDLVSKQKAGCDFAKNAIENPNVNYAEFKAEKGINGPLTEMAPKVYGDKLLWAGINSDTAVNLSRQEGDKYFSKIWVANPDGSEKTALPASVNDPKFHVGNPAITADGNRLYFTKCYEISPVRMQCDLFVTNKENGEWSASRALTINAEGYTSTHPAVGKDKEGNEILFFSSNREGGQGGMDLWYSVVNSNGSPAAPKNMGKLFNTYADEITPYYDPANGRLYFSSNGQIGMGGFDAMYVEGNVDAWDTVANLGSPLNTSYDDFYLALDSKGEKGYMVSNRPGGNSPRGITCCDDVYSAFLGKKTLYLKGYYTSKADPAKKAINGVEASMYVVNGDKFDFIGGTTTANDKHFVFQVEPGMQYKMNGTKTGYYPSVETVTMPEKIISMSDTINHIFYIEPIIITVTKVVHPVYFEFDKDNVRKLYQAKMDTLITMLKEYPSWTLSVEGHTDSKGSDEYNQDLSERRAKECLDYILSKGIDKARLSSTGFGEKNPLKPNTKPDGSDDPEGRAANRRVEFKLNIGPDKVTIKYDMEKPLSND